MHGYAMIDNAAYAESHMQNYIQSSTKDVCTQIIRRDEDERYNPRTIVSTNIVNVGSSSHPHWEVRFTYSDGSTYSYNGGSYHG